MLTITHIGNRKRSNQHVPFCTVVNMIKDNKSKNFVFYIASLISSLFDEALLIL
ncbi:Uncharacterised protein [Streptococcus constellatus]|uniref:Uncharacterized protein n=1 Tax=Streptococcus constellatus TaxID=76860 RepID=A0A564TRA6_STRCV|nr:Uncharacterised protein [Streptococcus gordonii]VUX09741.1 Uncharacterised protein [Streptococcus constellatus]